LKIIEISLRQSIKQSARFTLTHYSFYSMQSKLDTGSLRLTAIPAGAI